MADGEEDKGCAVGDFYSVLGLDKECSSGELKSAYKKLALRWHPDRCASGSAQVVEHAKGKFQEIQEAYSVLSDGNKRLMYDVGFYNSDDDENGMGDFLGEMAAMMNEHKPDPEKNAQESFQDLQDLFQEMFHADGGVSSGTHTTKSNKPPLRTTSLPASFASMPRGSAAATLKRDSADMTSGASRARTAPPAPRFADPFTSSGNGYFCFGPSSESSDGSARFSAPSSKGPSPGIPLHSHGDGGGRSRRNGRKQKVSSRHDVSSWGSRGVSAS